VKIDDSMRRINGGTFAATGVPLIEGRKRIVANGCRQGRQRRPRHARRQPRHARPRTDHPRSGGGRLSERLADRGHGRVTDPHLDTLQIALGDATPVAVTVGSDGTWSGTVTEPGGRYVVNVTATDKAGFVTTTGVPVTIDSTHRHWRSRERRAVHGRRVQPRCLADRARDRRRRWATVMATLNGQPSPPARRSPPRATHARGQRARLRGQHAPAKTINSRSTSRGDDRLDRSCECLDHRCDTRSTRTR